jgi:hypothetical protein
MTTIEPPRLPFTNCYINAAGVYGRDLIVELNRMTYPVYLGEQEVWNWTRENALGFVVDSTDPYTILGLYLEYLPKHSFANVSTLYMNGKRFSEVADPLQVLVRKMIGLKNVVIEGDARGFVWAIEKELDASLAPYDENLGVGIEEGVHSRTVLPYLERLEFRREDWHSRCGDEKFQDLPQYQYKWCQDAFVDQLIRTFKKWCTISGREKLPLIVIIEPSWLSHEHLEKLMSSGVVREIDSPKEDSEYMKDIPDYLW